MGVATDALLFYGYCWDEEAEAMSLWEPAWPDHGSAGEADEENDWETRYVRMRGGLRSLSQRAKKELLDGAACFVGEHCAASCPMPYVAVSASMTVSNRGDPQKISSLTVDPTWATKLAEFCAILRIKIGKRKPGWWLVSNWSE